MTDSRERLVIIGGGPAGLSAARGYRDAGGEGELRILSGDTEPPYARPPLSKEFLRGAAGDDDLPLEDPAFYADHDITLCLEETVTDLGEETVTTASGEELRFTSCVLATGAEPVRPPIPGADDSDVFLLRTAADARKLREAATGVRSAIVAGAGFIGCEAAVSLARLGLQVTVLCPNPVPQRQRLGDEAGRRILRWLKSEGVSVLCGTELKSVEGGYRVHTDLVPTMDAGLVLLATGARPRADLAEKAGLEVVQGRIRTDEHMRTSRAGILAAGDVALAHNTAAGRALPVEHWGEALTMGGIAGRTAAGWDASWDNAPGFWSVIGDRALKYAAWGDGFDDVKLVEHGDHDEDGFTVWYGRDGVTVGVLTHNADDDYDRGQGLVERGEPLP